MLKSVIGELPGGKFTTVITGAFAENAASIRVMEKCGMEKTDREEYMLYQGTKHTCIYYAAYAAKQVK